jgi:hypothetical protein
MEEIEKKMLKSRARLMEMHDFLCECMIDYYNSYMRFLDKPSPNTARVLSAKMRKTARMFSFLKKEYKVLRNDIAFNAQQRRDMARYKRQKRLDELAKKIAETEAVLKENFTTTP